jgi:dTMP kinase
VAGNENRALGLGYFIVLEGIDGSGKTSIGKFLENRLSEEMKVKFTCEPDDLQIIERLERIQQLPASAELVQAKALLFTADRALHTLKVMQWLQEGTNVICERYFMSTLAYQSAELQELEEPPEWMLRWLREINKPYIAIPDLLILLDSHPDNALRRLSERASKKAPRLPYYERPEMLRRVAECYDEEYRRYERRKLRLDADSEIEELRNRALMEVLKVIEERDLDASG